jgi:hypothetical protein
LLHVQIGWLGPFQVAIHALGDAPNETTPVRSIGHEASSFHLSPLLAHRRQLAHDRQIRELASVCSDEGHRARAMGGTMVRHVMAASSDIRSMSSARVLAASVGEFDGDVNEDCTPSFVRGTALQR